MRGGPRKDNDCASGEHCDPALGCIADDACETDLDGPPGKVRGAGYRCIDPGIKVTGGLTPAGGEINGGSFSLVGHMTLHHRVVQGGALRLWGRAEVMRAPATR